MNYSRFGVKKVHAFSEFSDPRYEWSVPRLSLRDLHVRSTNPHETITAEDSGDRRNNEGGVDHVINLPYPLTTSSICFPMYTIKRFLMSAEL